MSSLLVNGPQWSLSHSGLPIPHVAPYHAIAFGQLSPDCQPSWSADRSSAGGSGGDRHASNLAPAHPFGVSTKPGTIAQRSGSRDHVSNTLRIIHALEPTRAVTQKQWLGGQPRLMLAGRCRTPLNLPQAARCVVDLLGRHLIRTHSHEAVRLSPLTAWSVRMPRRRWAAAWRGPVSAGVGTVAVTVGRKGA